MGLVDEKLPPFPQDGAKYSQMNKARLSNYSRRIAATFEQFKSRSFYRSSRRLTWPFTPDLLRYLIWKDQLLLPNIRKTTWMDGLRGWAALIVFNFHFFYAFSDGIVVGYGYDSKHMSYFELPGLCLMSHGAVAVNIFFVVAGYVCSAKALQLMTENQVEELMEGLWRSVFRRVFRLYLPVACVSLMTAIAAYIGLFEYLRPIMDRRKEYFPGHLSEPQLEGHQTMMSQLSFWLMEFGELMNVFRPGPFYPTHDNHLWSVQYEFRGSMHLYIVLVGLARVRPLMRLGSLVLISVVYLSWDRWEGPLFFMGAAMAQYDTMRISRTCHLSYTGNLDSKNQLRACLARCRRSVRILSYALSIYLMSFPIANLKYPAPGYAFLNRLIPHFYGRKEKFPVSVGVLMFFYLLNTSENHILSKTPSVLHRVLTCWPARYLAKNMFALYLVHGPLLHMFGYAMPHLAWKLIPNNTPVGWMAGVTIGWMTALSTSLLAADVFTREVDTRCTKLTNWLERSISVDEAT